MKTEEDKNLKLADKSVGFYSRGVTKLQALDAWTNGRKFISLPEKH